jgi:hypothetical protein
MKNFKNDYISLNLNKLTSFSIKKYKNVFIIGDLKINYKYLNFINLGLKFIPSFNKCDLYLYLYNFYNSLSNFNNSCFYKSYNTNRELNNNLNTDDVFSYIDKKYLVKSKNLPILSTSLSFRKEYLSNLFKCIDYSTINEFHSLDEFNSLIKHIYNNNIEICNADNDWKGFKLKIFL